MDTQVVLAHGVIIGPFRAVRGRSVHCERDVRDDEQVSSKPDWNRSVAASRLDPYRHRAATLSRDGVEVGTLYVEPDHLTTQTGHLWWRSFSDPREFVKLWITIDGDSTDAWTDGQELDTDLENWSRGIFVFGGETYACTWLDNTQLSPPS
ncbi:MAG: hypothetical protein IPL41_07590 [Micropruina sp.]|nr:hypothetical protein [Micropruina sp.]